MPNYIFNKKIYCMLFVMVVVLMGLSINTEAASLNQKKATIYVGGANLKLKLSGEKAKSWKSSKKSVATVSKKGVVTPKKAGKTTITCTSKSNKKHSS